MPLVTLGVTTLRRTAIQERTQSVQNGMRRGASHDSRDYGMPAWRRTIVEIIVPHAPAWECLA
ncbi:hypothetical protein ALQ14_03183 [Pseudomonas savastanoi pv. glycinea]|nr:hypothetical protein ALQ14_03183 [Pseudomonas savastanoi pv. glycinea]